MRVTIVFTFLTFLATACQSENTPVDAPAPDKMTTKVERVSIETIRPETDLPTAFGKPLAEHKAGLVSVPKGMLLVSQVTRPRAEVRGGPGIQFDLADQILDQGTKVLVFMRHGVWLKIMVPGTWQSGWVHSQALAEPKPSQSSITVDGDRLPTVLALHPVDTVSTFPAQAQVPVSIPKGAMFRSLLFAENDALIWLPDTKSVMWMSRKDVQ